MYGSGNGHQSSVYTCLEDFKKRMSGAVVDVSGVVARKDIDVSIVDVEFHGRPIGRSMKEAW